MLVSTSDGGTIAATEAGGGPPWILVHGFTTGPNDWQACADLLVDAGQRVILPWLRGHGESQASTGGSGIDRLAQDVVELADGLGLDQFCLAGHSLGGTVAIAAAARLDGRAQRLGLVAATARAARGGRRAGALLFSSTCLS